MNRHFFSFLLFALVMALAAEEAVVALAAPAHSPALLCVAWRYLKGFPLMVSVFPCNEPMSTSTPHA